MHQLPAANEVPVMSKKLLIARDLIPQITGITTFLDRTEIEIVPADTSEELLQIHRREQANLVITRPDLPRMPCETLLNIFRRSMLLRNASVILLCEQTPAQLDRCRASGANAVMTRPVDASKLERVVQELLHVTSRRAYRVVLSMSVKGRKDGKGFLCSTENVSSNGMLVRTAELLPPGSRITCSFLLPDGTRISAKGSVARTARRDAQTRKNRYGIHLTTLTPEAKTALAAFVHQESRLQPAEASRKSALLRAR